MKKLEITLVLDKILDGYKPSVKHELMLGNRHSNTGYHGIYYRKIEIGIMLKLLLIKLITTSILVRH